MWAHQATWEVKASVLSTAEFGWLLKIRGCSSGGRCICALGVKGRTVGESLHPGGESVWPCGEVENMLEVLCEALRSWFALRVLAQMGFLTQIGHP